MTMADKIVVLNAGNIEQVGSPLELYRRPKNLFVAGFIGSPKMNLVESDEARTRYACKTIGIRPEHIAISRTPVDGVWHGTVGVAEHLGADTFVHVHTDGQGMINVRASGEVPVSHGDEVWLTPDPSKIHRFDASGQAIY
jgi:multiple sugar transport system ATP-binding protein